MDVDSIIRAARQQYTADGVSLKLPHQERASSQSDTVRPSGLGLCALQAAYQKHGVKPDYPEMGISDSTQWIMQHGNYVAPMIQEPLMWYAVNHADISFVPEYPVQGELFGVKVSGRCDGVLTVEDLQMGGGSRFERCVLEIKDTEGKQDRSVGEPQLRYVWQTLLYMQLLGISRGAIITVSKWGWNVWNIVPVADGWQVVDEKGAIYHPMYGDQWNSALTINLHNLEVELHRQDFYLKQVKALQDGSYDKLLHPIPPPIQDPLNNPMGWLCGKQWEKPKVLKTKTTEGRMSPNCAFAGRCHGWQNKSYTTVLKDGKIQVK